MTIPELAARRLPIAAIGLACAAAWGEPLTPAQFLPVAASVVRVEAVREQGGLSMGSGVTVGPSVVATSCHVVRDAVEIRVAASGATWRVDGEQSDVRRDVCLLRVPAWRGKPVELAQENSPQPGAPVAALGFTGGARVSPRLGHVVALHAFDDGRVIESSAPFNSGSSGGGLFDAGGALIGLLTFRLRNSAVSYYSVPVQWIRERLAGAQPWASVGPLTGALPFWQGEGDALPHFMRTSSLALPAAATANDFPTHARVDFVLACMRGNPSMAQEAVYKCSCAIDAIAARVKYDEWVELSTVANGTTIAGERGGVMRDIKDGRKIIASFRELQDRAKKSCFVQK